MSKSMKFMSRPVKGQNHERKFLRYTRYDRDSAPPQEPEIDEKAVD